MNFGIAFGFAKQKWYRDTKKSAIPAISKSKTIPKLISYKNVIGIAGIAVIHPHNSNILTITFILLHDQSSASDMFQSNIMKS